MSEVASGRAGLSGAAWATLAVILFSVNDVLMKFLSTGFALHQLVLIRAAVGLALLLAVMLPFMGGLAALRTRRLKLHVVRALCVVFANIFFFMGLAALPLAEAVAVFFVSPLLISLGSVVFLGESVGPRRWAAIGLGLVGVLVVLRPGTDAFQAASLFPLVAAACYAGLNLFTRKMGPTESAAAFVFYIQVTFIVVAVLVGLVAGQGDYAGSGHPSLEFLLRAWTWPPAFELGIIAATGVMTVIAGYAISLAYKTSEAAFVAPFEYAAMPLSVLWGWLVFAELPDATSFVGIALILTAGLVLVWREAFARRAPPSRPPAPR